MPQSGARRRYFVRALLVLLFLSFAAASGGLFYLKNRISPELVSAEASEILRRRFGFSLSIGEIRLTWSGNAELKRICVRNEALQSARCLFSADIVQLDLRLLPLLRRQVEIRGAQLENCEINLFSESVEAADNKKITRNSWEGSFAAATEGTPGTATAGESQTAVRLDTLAIRNAVISHEVRVLPIPLGKTDLSLELRNAGRRLTFRAQLPDQSRVHAELDLAIADFLAAARLIVQGPRLAERDHFSGFVECDQCDLSAFDQRAAALTGKIRVEASARELRLAGEGVKIRTRVNYAPALVWHGSLGLVLPEFAASAGEGSLTGQGLVLQYRRLSSAPKSGIEADFDIAADLARLPGITAIRGSATAHGQLRNRTLAARFLLHNLTTSAGGFAIASEHLEGALRGSRILIDKQRVQLNGNSAQITLQADVGTRPMSLQGSVAFSELNLNNLLQTEKPAAETQVTQEKSPASYSAKASLQIAATALKLGQWQTGPFTAQLYTDGKSTAVKPWQVELGQGRIQGSYQKQADGRQNLSFRVMGVKAQNLHALLGFRAALYGVIDADGWLMFTGNNIDAVLKTGNGQISFRLGRGKIRDSFLQRGVLSGPLHKLEEKFSDIEFASAQAEVLLNPNKIQIQRFFFDAEEWNVTFRAEADAQWQGKAELGLRFRTSFVENVANPLHMGISERKEGDYYDLPFVCRGAVLTGECYKKNW